MKKLNLQLGSIKEMLTKEQMKKVAGGYDDGGGQGCDVTCWINDVPTFCTHVSDCTYAHQELNRAVVGCTIGCQATDPACICQPTI